MYKILFANTHAVFLGRTCWLRGAISELGHSRSGAARPRVSRSRCQHLTMASHACVGFDIGFLLVSTGGVRKGLKGPCLPNTTEVGVRHNRHSGAPTRISKSKGSAISYGTTCNTSQTKASISAASQVRSRLNPPNYTHTQIHPDRPLLAAAAFGSGYDVPAGRLTTTKMHSRGGGAVRHSIADGQSHDRFFPTGVATSRFPDSRPLSGDSRGKGETVGVTSTIPDLSVFRWSLTTRSRDCPERRLPSDFWAADLRITDIAH